MGNLQPRSKIVWSLAATNIGDTLTEAGNSGGWQGVTGGWPNSNNAETNVDLREIPDVALYVTAAGITGSPSLVVNLDVYDNLGNLFPAVLSTAALTGAGSKSAAGGLHGGSASTYLVLPDWGRVSWTLTGGTVTGAQIVLYGR